MKYAEIAALIGLTGCAHTDESPELTTDRQISDYHCTEKQMRLVKKATAKCAEVSYSWIQQCEEMAIRDICALRRK